MFYKNHCIHDGFSDEENRPYEKCFKFGAEVLTDSELLAVIIRTGVAGSNSIALANQILILADEQKGLLSLANLTIQQLMSVKGVGKVKAIQIKCICELARRMARQSAAKRLDFSNPEAIATYYMQDMRYLEKEHLLLILLDSKCRKIHDMVLSIGTINSALVEPREVFAEALKLQAASVILLHNHPSGDATPSREDIRVTQRIRSAGELMGIPLLDHIVIGDNVYTSLKEKEYL